MRLPFSILKKFIMAFLLLSIVPIVVLGVYTTHHIWKVGARAIDSSTAELERRAREAIELRAIELADRVAHFLRGCEADLYTLQMLPPDPQVYQRFSLTHRGRIWTREGTNEAPVEVRRDIPLYREIAFIGPAGRELVRIVDDQIAEPHELRDVSRPENTTYRCERYFEETRSLPAGEIYVSHVTGWYVTREEQLQGAPSVEAAVEGRKYEGVVRFAVPSRADDGSFQGMVMLSLDHRHLMEMTQHVLPTEERFVLFPSYSSGNYAFMFDDEGWMITHPKFWDIRGVLPDGSMVDPGAPGYNRERMVAGVLPFNLDHVDFIHPNYPFIAQQVREGRSGVTNTFSVGGVPRVMAYAPIFYESGPYRKHGIFGGITIGVQTAKFQEPALLTRTRIDEMVAATKRNALLVVALSALAAVVLAVVLARTFTRPILCLTRRAQEIAQGRPARELDVHTGDELEILAREFARMDEEIRLNRESLERSLAQLEESKRAVESHSEELEKRIRILKNIHYLSHYLGVVFDGELVLRTVLKTCVEGLGFDRALLYLYDADSGRLVCRDTFGFSPEQDRLARSASYDLCQHDCIPTKVYRFGETIFVKDIHSEKLATPLDLKISQVGGSFVFVFTPVKVRDQVIGVLGADNAVSRRPIEEVQVESLQILANDAARAVERSQLYEQITTERNFIQSIFRHMTSGIITLNDSGTITSMNPYVERVFEVSRAAAVQKPFVAAFADHPEWTGAVQAFLGDSTRNEHQMEQVVRRGGGREAVLEVHLSRIRQEKNIPPTVLILLRDVTNRKRLEKYLRRSDRLISLGTLAAGIAHEIRNPLTGVSLMLDDLHDHLVEHPGQRDIIERALQEIERLEKLISGLLDFASPSRDAPRSPRAVDAEIQQTLFLVKKQCRSRGVRVSVGLEPGLPPLRMDPERFRQALLNLFLNAVQAMPDGGELSLTVQRVGGERSLLESDAVSFRIADTGCGIDPADMDYIFDPFFTRNPSGVGLGLSIVHSIVEEHGGRITVSSTPGKGTVFRLDFPVDGEMPAAGAA